MIQIRNYNPKIDYEAIKSLYEDSATFGGQFGFKGFKGI